MRLAASSSSPAGVLAVGAALAALAALSCGRSQPAADTATAPPATGVQLVSGDSPARPPMLDPNAATVAELTALPGVSDSTALAIIAGRPYVSVIALDRVLARHFSGPRRDSLYSRLWLPVPLNTASSDEILLIPGVDDSLRRALEEHRPYAGLEELRRELGEAVGRDEVARLEPYVTVP